MKTESREYIEFTAKRNNIQIKGFVCVDEIDGDECVQYYNHQGFENGYNIPTNPYTEPNEHQEYEILKEALFTDNLFLQFLWDFKDENKIIERGDYTLIINDGMEI